MTFTSLAGSKIKNPARQVYVLITEKNANTNDIKSLCAEQLGVDNIALTVNGLPTKKAKHLETRPYHLLKVV